MLFVKVHVRVCLCEREAYKAQQYGTICCIVEYMCVLCER